MKIEKNVPVPLKINSTAKWVAMWKEMHELNGYKTLEKLTEDT